MWYPIGDTGEKGVVWHTFGGDALKAKLTAALGNGGGASHFIRLYADWSQRDNDESILVRETVGGVTNTEKIGSVPIYAERGLGLRLEYEWLCAGGSGIRAGGEWYLRNRQSSLTYPQLREQHLDWWRLWAEGVWTGRRVELAAALWLRNGSHNETERSVAGDAASQSFYPEHLLTYADWNNEYMTALRAGAKLGVRINIVKGFYADLSARYEHGFRLKFVPQPNRIESMLSLGYKW